MNLRARLAENPDSVPLNSAGHAVEHCAVDPAALDALGSAVGRQLLVRRSSERLALYTVVAVDDVPPRTVQVGTEGLARLGDDLDYTASVETDFTGGDPEARARLSEQLLGDEGTGLAILAPHGGRIERGTDLEAESVYDSLAQHVSPVRGWIARGFNSGPTGAHACWHITSSELSENSFPKLRSLFAGAGSRGPFAHAVAFHGNNDSEAVVVGGGLPRDQAHTALKAELSARIRAELAEVMSDPPAVEVQLSGPLAGAQRANVVNRITALGNGIQIEQPLAVRDDADQREAVARAVAGFYLEDLR
ncbi:MAG TPA: poly-gamma-glutamate hydrolase family protein [Thermoleophilaceae bacterium]|jgi:phage replication-related protein YjqB (UPF0714/DUF867 family)